MTDQTHGDSRGRMVACIAALASILVFSLSANILPAALIRASSEFGVQAERLSQVVSGQFTGFVLITVVAGVLADYFGKKVLFILSCALIAAGAVVWANAHGTGAAFLGGGLMGMGGGIIESLASALLSDLFPTRRKLLLNLSQVVYCVGAVGGPALMGWLMPLGVSWRVFFVALAILSTVSIGLFAASHLPRPSHDERIDLDKLKTIAKRPSFLLPCLILFLYVLGETATALYVNYYLKEFMHAPESWAIYGISCFWMAMAVGRLICAAVPETVSYEWLVSGLCAVGAFALLVQHWVVSWQISFLWFGLTGLSLAGSWPLIVGLTAIRNPKYSGSVLGATIACGACGCVAAPWMMRFFLATVPIGWVFPLTGVPLALAAILVASMHWMPHPKVDEPAPQ